MSTADPRIIVPYTELNELVIDELGKTGFPLECVPVSSDDDAYRRLLRDLWQQRRTVFICEHDVLVWPGAVKELFDCSCVWGAYSYELHGGIGIYHGFGATKITPTLMDAVPDIWNEPCKWDVLDQKLYFAARAVGYEPHPHRPPVVHLSKKHARRYA